MTAVKKKPAMTVKQLTAKKPSEILEIALTDLQKCERDRKHYKVQMSAIHDPIYPGDRYDDGDEIKAQPAKCAVCFAGSVMAQTMQLPPGETYPGNWFNGDVFQAIDDFRKGEIRQAFETLERKLPYGLASRVELPEYSADKSGFKAGIRKLIGLLKVFKC